MLRATFLVLAQIAVTAAKKAPEPEPAGNPVVDFVLGIANPIISSSMDLATDAVGLLMAAPGFGRDVFVWAVGLVRQAPAVIKNVYNGDDATLDTMTSFCVHTAGTIFVVYASLTALNLLLGLAVTVKNYFASYMEIPTEVLGQKLPGPVRDVRDLLQKNIVDRIRNLECKAWVVPLEGQSGTPSLAGATPVLASAVSACMILSCAPAIHSLMKNGADKAAAEALAYTMGTALGVQYLVGKLR